MEINGGIEVSRMEIMKELDAVLQVCKDNECKMDCEHVDEIRVFGNRLIESTKKSRKERGIVESTTIYVDRLDYREIKSMIEDGMTNKEIIEELNIIEEATYYQFLRRRNIVNENKEEPSHKGILLSKFKKMIDGGMATADIARNLNINDASLRGFLRANNVDNPNKIKGKR